MKDIVLLPEDVRIAEIDAGFRYGSPGRSGMARFSNRVQMLLRQNIHNGDAIWSQLDKKMNEVYDRSDFSVLRDYFSKAEVVKTLFDLSIYSEGLAFKCGATIPIQSAESPIRSVIAAICDYSGIDRGKVL